MKKRLAFLIIIQLITGLSIAQRFNFSNFTVKNGLPGNQVNKLIQDRFGRLWVCTMNGAVRFDGKVFTPFSEDNILSTNPVKTVYEDKAGNLWFGTIRKGLIKYSGTNFKNYTSNDGLLSDIVNVVVEDKNGKIWIGTSEGLSSFDGKRFVHSEEAPWVR